jgi:hypothetical protein
MKPLFHQACAVAATRRETMQALLNAQVFHFMRFMQYCAKRIMADLCGKKLNPNLLNSGLLPPRNRKFLRN